MVDFLLGLLIGTIAGIGAICLLQINRYEEIERDSENEK